LGFLFSLIFTLGIPKGFPLWCGAKYFLAVNRTRLGAGYRKDLIRTKNAIFLTIQEASVD
jgi:hypothetical protein